MRDTGSAEKIPAVKCSHEVQEIKTAKKKKKNACFHLGTRFLLFNATAIQERKTFTP